MAFKIACIYWQDRWWSIIGVRIEVTIGLFQGTGETCCAIWWKLFLQTWLFTFQTVHRIYHRNPLWSVAIDNSNDVLLTATNAHVHGIAENIFCFVFTIQKVSRVVIHLKTKRRQTITNNFGFRQSFKWSTSVEKAFCLSKCSNVYGNEEHILLDTVTVG